MLLVSILVSIFVSIFVSRKLYCVSVLSPKQQTKWCKNSHDEWCVYTKRPTILQRGMFAAEEASHVAVLEMMSIVCWSRRMIWWVKDWKETSWGSDQLVCRPPFFLRVISICSPMNMWVSSWRTTKRKDCEWVAGVTIKRGQSGNKHSFLLWYTITRYTRKQSWRLMSIPGLIDAGHPWRHCFFSWSFEQTASKRLDFIA